MSRLLVTNKSFELLEPYEGKLSRTVLRGESSRKGADLLDIEMYLNEAHSQGLRSVKVPLQRHGMGRERSGVEAHPQRRGLAARADGMHAASQHGGRAGAVLGGDSRQRGRLPRRGEFLHLSRSGPLPFQRGDQLPLVALALRNQDVRPPVGHSDSSGYLGSSDEARRHHESE